ncbi:hypothetical protein STAS_09522 [Striga asiatica]|uniref:Uncharacterized protein n=1 Tax=Striga asiatica TaxID=4170 RepID=A0A5A7PL66_STRAF|nr:hypothetical protein STAS_09522 [Striga asiatica]
METTASLSLEISMTQSPEISDKGSNETNTASPCKRWKRKPIPKIEQANNPITTSKSTTSKRQLTNEEDISDQLSQDTQQQLKKQKTNDSGTVSRKLGLGDRWSAFDPEGKSGGLLLLWDENVHIFQIKKNSFCFQVEFWDESKDKTCWAIFLYASTNNNTRQEQWNFLLQEQVNWGDYWFAGGDWNDTTCPEEKKGGRPRSLNSFSSFNGFISLMGMHDLGIQGHKFTWANNRQDEGFVEEQLDRVFCSLGWLSLYSNPVVANIFLSSSDHGMLILNSNNEQQSKKKRFIFDQRWIQREGFEEVVKKAWSYFQMGTPMFCFQQKIKAVRMDLLKWSCNFRTENAKKIASLHKKLTELRWEGGLRDWKLWDDIQNQLN